MDLFAKGTTKLLCRPSSSRPSMLLPSALSRAPAWNPLPPPHGPSQRPCSLKYVWVRPCHGWGEGPAVIGSLGLDFIIFKSESRGNSAIPPRPMALLIFTITILDEKGQIFSHRLRRQMEGHSPQFSHRRGTKETGLDYPCWSNSIKLSMSQGSPRAPVEGPKSNLKTRIAAASETEGHNSTGWNLLENHGPFHLRRSRFSSILVHL